MTGRIFIDADACPVKAEAERVATRHQMRMILVSNGGIRPSANPLVESVFVASGPDEADKWIAEACGVGDVVVTGDIPLAAKCVSLPGPRWSSTIGEELTPANIGNVLATRDLMQDLRSADPFRQGGGRPVFQGGPLAVSGSFRAGCAASEAVMSPSG